MGRVSLSSPLPSEYPYIPVRTGDVDSTTNQSVVELPTINAAAAITIESAHLEPPASIPLLPPPQPQPIPEEREASDPLEDAMVGVLLLLAASVVLYPLARALVYTMTFRFDPYGPEIHVHSVSFSIQNITWSQITTKGEIEFDIKRPIDCASPVYDNTMVSLFFDEKPLSMTVMEPFTQKGVNHTIEKATFPSITSPIDVEVARRIDTYVGWNSSFVFSFDVKAEGTFWPNDWMGQEDPRDRANARWVNIWCPNVMVEMVARTGMGTMAGKPLKCEAQAQNPPR